MIRCLFFGHDWLMVLRWSYNERKCDRCGKRQTRQKYITENGFKVDFWITKK